MKLVSYLVVKSIRFGQLFAGSLGESSPFRPTRDVRTALGALSVEPELKRSVCCSKCFAPYTLESLPETCTRRETPGSRPCGEQLWTTRQTKGGPRRVPRRLYTTQSFISWLEHFLSRPEIEALVDAPAPQRRRDDPRMRGIRDSPAWRSLGEFTFQYGNLVFSYYIDWFNPLTNKIAGKKVSCGAIMLFCLNLPYELAHAEENTFFAGLTPPPFEPNIVTITAVQDPVVDELETMYLGRMIRSANHPTGLFRRVAVLPLIADLLALQKAGGFAGHAHKSHFCWYCPLPRRNIERVDSENWGIRNGTDVRIAGQEWRDATTKTRRKEIFDAKGHRWSSLLRLTYRDPVRHCVLGVMHNWLEGVLQHHARRLWGLGVDSLSDGDPDVAVDIDAEAQMEPLDLALDDLMDLDADTVDDELSDIISDSQSHADTPSQSRQMRRLATSSSLATIFEPEPLAETGDSGDEDWVMADNESSDEDLDEADAKPGAQCIFSAAQLGLIRDCIGDVVVPTWLARPPRNLGNASHGKLKADTWFVLFTVHLLIALPEMWGRSKDIRHRLFLGNFLLLVVCTNIVCSFSTSNEDADQYTANYVKYRQTLRHLFPNMTSVPNHHYAMHNGPQLKFWGPLMGVSEFPYERHNGTFQKVPKNNHMGVCSRF
jgi:hypothetical protein